ncbi:hypothetical protein [Ruminococcus sp.]|uniref:hypothetical protein n=1 Tax=Ruminococcus sp. TaxID=41978 RepID=UPI0025CF0042|nr:hypothetical protein [Ruminococcus sp.]
MDHRVTYSLITEKCLPEIKSQLMTLPEFEKLSIEDQAKELKRAIEISGADKSMINYAYNMPFEKKKAPPSSPGLMKITAISMIAGFILICGAFFFYSSDKELAGLIIATGLILAAGVPAVCYFIDRIFGEKAMEREKKEIELISGNSADSDDDISDTNYAGITPPKAVLWEGAAGIIMISAALVLLSLLKGTTLGIVQGILFFAGFMLLSISLKQVKRYDIALLLIIPALLGLTLLIFSLTAVLFPDILVIALCCSLIDCGILILLMPAVYNIVKKRRCTEEITAECVYVQYLHGRYGDQYRPYWSYTYNGIYYTHKDLMSRRAVSVGETINLRINPSAPHDVYRLTLPRICSYLMLICGFSAFFALMAAAGFPLS